MFINIKLNGKLLVKILFILLSITVTIYFVISAYKIYKNCFKVKDESEENIMYLTAESYTNVLKTICDNIDDYVGKNICFTGYVYRLSDFKDTQFVLARDMIISSDIQTLIVGFLCDLKNAKDFENETWIEITGEITKGNYHGDMPIIKVKSIEKINKPKDDLYVYPPDEDYISTSNIF